MARAILLLASFVAVLAAACGGGGSKATPTASLSPSPASADTPTPTLTAEPSPEPGVVGHPKGTRTGDPQWDAVIAALETGDFASIEPLVDWERVACRGGSTGHSSERPDCPEGVADGAEVEALPEIGCEGEWYVHTPGSISPPLAVGPADRLYSVWKGPPGSIQRNPNSMVIYVDSQRPGRFEAVLLRDGLIVLVYHGCDGLTDELGWRGGEKIFPRPSR